MEQQIKKLEDRLKVTTDAMSAVIMQLKINRLKKIIKNK
jgi:uncharacterized protein (UPF0548 family)